MGKHTDIINEEIKDALSLLDRLRNDLGLSNETVNAMMVLAEGCLYERNLPYNEAAHGYRVVSKARRYNLDIEKEYKVRAKVE